MQLVYLWASASPIIQASNIWRGRRGAFDEAWDEGASKFGGILIAAIGFQFVVWAAGYVGSFLGAARHWCSELVAAFFLIYTIPAAAIGGMPGTLAISRIDPRGARESRSARRSLAIVFVALWYRLPVPIGLPLPAWRYLAADLDSSCQAAVKALVLAYLAFPFAKAIRRRRV